MPVGKGSLQSIGSCGSPTGQVERAEERTRVQTLHRDHVLEQAPWGVLIPTTLTPWSTPETRASAYSFYDPSFPMKFPLQFNTNSNSVECGGGVNQLPIWPSLCHATVPRPHSNAGQISGTHPQTQ